METNNLINGLKHLSEGLFLPEEWIDWWQQNEKFAKQFLSPRWYLKIKPKMSQGLMGAALISQNAAREYLKSINQSYNENSQVNYMEGWRKQIDDISLNCDKVDIIDFDMLELREEYIKIGELWLNSDGDELYIRPYEASVYFHDIGKNQIHIINKSFNLFIENDLSRFVYENALPNTFSGFSNQQPR